MSAITLELRHRKQYGRLWDWKPSPQQQLPYYSDADEVWLLGGNRSGKTECVCAVMAQFAQGVHPVRSLYQKPPVKIRHCATDWMHGVEGILLNKYKALIPEAWLVGDSWSDAWSAALHGFRFKNDSYISFRTFEQEKNKFGGEDLDAIAQDEIGPEGHYIENRARLVDRRGFFMAAMTPEDGITWEQEHVENPPPGLRIEHFYLAMDANPHLSEEGKAQLKASIKDPVLAEAKLLGHFVVLSGRVIPTYDAPKTIIPDPQFKGSRVFCIDLHTKAPSAALWASWEPCEDREGFEFVVYRTHKACMTVPEWKEYIATKSAGEKINLWLGDESERETGTPGIYGQDSIIQAFNVADEKTNIRIPLVQVEKGPGSFDAGIMRLRDAFQPDTTKRPRILICESCNYGVPYIGGKPAGSLPWELKRYAFKPETAIDAQGLREKVRKIHDHFIDDVRYLYMVGPMSRDGNFNFDVGVYGN